MFSCMQYYNQLLFILTFTILFHYSLTSNISITAYTQPGYYFSHRCETTLQIISNYFQTQNQLFHIFALQNTHFFNTTENHNIFYIKGTNSIEEMMTSSEIYCRKKMSSQYYCPFISVEGYNPYGIRYYETVNSTHYRLTIRLTRTICPQQGVQMSFRIQMPTHFDYSSFYMYVPNIFNTTPITSNNLSFIYDNQVFVNTSNLSYKQVKSINSIITSNTFVIGCQLNYTITFRIDNISYYTSWDQISVYVSNVSVVQLSMNCTSNLSQEYSCVRMSYGYNLVKNNQSNMVKSYEIANQEYYYYQPYFFTLSFGLKFIQTGRVDVEVVVKAINNSIQEEWLDMAHNDSEIYGRKVFSLSGYSQQVFGKLQSNKYDPSMCLSSNDGDFNNPTNRTNNNDNGNNLITSGQQSFQTSRQIAFIVGVSIIISITLFFAKFVNICEKLFFMITIVGLSILKILYLALQVDEISLFESSDSSLSDSLIHSNTHGYSLELFILKYIFILQFSLNALYFLNYLVLIICSQQILYRIKKFYRTKIYIKNALSHIQNQSKINRCNLSSIIFTFISVLTFLINFKIYSLLILKLQIDTHPENSEFKKYRFRNSVIYKIHCSHLGIDLLLEANALIWLFMTIKNCENQIFTVILYIILAFYSLHEYLMTVFLKSFILMARKTDNLNFQQQKKLQNTTQNLQTLHEIEDENELQIHEVAHENNVLPVQLTQQIGNKQSSQMQSNPRPAKKHIKLPTQKQINSKQKNSNLSNK